MENYENFKKSYFELSHINLNAYKEKQMKRRIETLISRKGLDSFAAYSELLKSDSQELEKFTDYITINVTEFFRTTEHWKFLEEKVIPMMKENAVTAESAAGNSGASHGCNLSTQLKIWSAGCSTGEEPYSLSMLFLQHFSPEHFKILATDIDEGVLKKAEKGCFDKKSMETIPEEYSHFKEKYFDATQFKIGEAVKNQIEFKKMDMTAEVFPQNYDLIVCRNVLIYFTEETKHIIFRKFVDSLKPGGILFFGHTEQIVYYKNYGLEKLAKNFYRKKLQ